MPNFFSTASSIGRPWQSQPGTYGASKPASSFDLTTMSLSILLTAWPMWIAPFAYGGPSCRTNAAGPARVLAHLRVQALRFPARRACPARASAGRRASGTRSPAGGWCSCSRLAARVGSRSGSAAVFVSLPQDGARLLGIAVHLPHQRRQVVEFLLVAQLGDELDLDARPYRSPSKSNRCASSNGSVPSTVGRVPRLRHRRPAARADAVHPGRVDAAQRRRACRPRRRLAVGIAERAAELACRARPAADRVAAAEQRARPRRDRRRRARARMRELDTRSPSTHHRRDRRPATKPCSRPAPAAARGRRARPWPKRKSGPDPDFARATAAATSTRSTKSSADIAASPRRSAAARPRRSRARAGPRTWRAAASGAAAARRARRTRAAAARS